MNLIGHNTLRETSSICPVCYTRCPAAVIEKDNKILLKKRCLEHKSTFVVLSDSPAYYRELDRLYFNIMDEVKSLADIELYLTGRCNMRCSICCLSLEEKGFGLGEPSIDEIRQFIQNGMWSFVTLTGGEATSREDLPEIIAMICGLGKTVTMNTNGIRLADRDYVLTLKKAGLHRVSIQFDGFQEETEQRLGRSGFLPQKLRALAHVNELGLAAALNMVVVRGSNDRTLMDMLSFVAGQPHVTLINLLTVAPIGSADHAPAEDYLMPDQLVDTLVRDSDGVFKKENIFLFQKFHLAVKSLFRQRFCFYTQLYVAVRVKGGYLPIDAFLNFRYLDFWVKKYEFFYKKNRIISAACLVLGAVSLLLSRNSWQIAQELISSGVSYLVRSGDYFRPPRLFYICFTTGCDPYKIDYGIVKNCHNEMACACDPDPLKYHGRSADFYTEREKMRHACRP